MSDQFDNTNRGAVWKNDKKESDRHPDFKGSINIEGKEYWLSGWKRKEGGHPNSPALSLSVQPKEEPQQVTDTNNAPAKDDFEDLIPF